MIVAHALSAPGRGSSRPRVASISASNATTAPLVGESIAPTWLTPPPPPSVEQALPLPAPATASHAVWTGRNRRHWTKPTCPLRNQFGPSGTAPHSVADHKAHPRAREVHDLPGTIVKRDAWSERRDNLECNGSIHRMSHDDYAATRAFCRREGSGPLPAPATAVPKWRGSPEDARAAGHANTRSEQPRALMFPWD